MNDALDLLKQDWKKGNDRMPQYTEVDIYKMIHKSSSSVVKWIVVVSFIELALWIFLSYMLKKPSSFKENFEFFDQYYFVTISEILSYGVIVYFIYKFYINYQKINASDSVKVLMSNIINTRKTVINYVKTIIVLSVLTIIISFFILINFDTDLINTINEAEVNDNLGLFYLTFVLIFIVYTALVILIIWGFYKLIYGFFLKKLYQNYSELKQLE